MGVKMKRRKLISLFAVLGYRLPVACYAHEPKQLLERVGSPAPIPCPLRPDNLAVRRLAELGWIEGKTSSSIPPMPPPLGPRPRPTDETRAETRMMLSAHPIPAEDLFTLALLLRPL